MKNILVWFLVLLSKILISQNLVGNGGFEIINSCPRVFAPIELANGWYKVSGGLYYPNSFNLCADSMEFINTFPGLHKPRTGNGFAGFHAGVFESFQTKLLTTLEKNKQYVVEFYIRYEKSSFDALTPIYGILSKYSYYDSIVKYEDIQSQVSIYNYELLRKSDNWVKINGIYTAKGNEKYFTIAYLNMNMQKHPFCQCYYYIDDISVHPLNEEFTTTQTNAENDSVSFKVGDIIRLENINFEYNKSILLPNSFPILYKLSDYLKNNLEISIVINGYTDNLGSKKRNYMLSRARAKSVYDYLIKNGINKNRMKFDGYGSSQPLNDNATEIERKQNRRVEIRLLIKN